MKKSIYFASMEEGPLPGPCLALGFGFTPEGAWREGIWAGAAGVVLDDRHPPSEAGLAAAEQALRDWEGCILCDFEGLPEPGLIRLLQRWEGREVIVPEAWAAWPHRYVLLRPYAPGVGFHRWLRMGQARYGAVVLDAAPIHCRVPFGQPPEAVPALFETKVSIENAAEDAPFSGAGGSAESDVPAEGGVCAPGGRAVGRENCRQQPSDGPGWDCPGTLCRCRMEAGAFCFWDTRRTLTQRCRAAAVPSVVLLQEWSLLPSGPSEQE